MTDPKKAPQTVEDKFNALWHPPVKTLTAKEEQEIAERCNKMGLHPIHTLITIHYDCLLYTSPSPRDQRGSRMPSSA